MTSYSILINGTELNSAYNVLSIIINKKVNSIPIAEIVLQDGTPAIQKFEISDSEDLLPGRVIEIKAGNGGENHQAFKGIITGHALTIKEKGVSQLLIHCSDEAVRMTAGRHSRYFQQLKDSDVFEQLIGSYKLTGDAEATNVEHKELVQQHMSDWDFILLRAEANGMLANVNAGTVKIRRPSGDAKPVLSVVYGESLIDFQAEMDARYQWKNVEATSWDYASQDLLKAIDSGAWTFAEPGNISSSKLSTTLGLDKFQLHHGGQLPQPELQDWADAVMLRSKLAKIKGRAKIQGNAAVNPGDLVTLRGISDRFNGDVYIAAVTQEISNGDWYTYLEFGLDSTSYAAAHREVNELPSAGLIGSIHGLQIGKVLQLESDPDGQDRILVKMPVIDNNAAGTWVRVASLDAGSGRGAFFRPEIGDEVIVGFVNSDPRQAVMLGMLHSSAKPAPINAHDSNDEKGFTTRSKMHIYFNDRTKTISIDTPSGNSIILDEEGARIEIRDQNNNKISLNSNGIKLESPLNVEINAGINLTLSAGSAVNVKAPSISGKADANLDLEGALTKLSATGITEISGSLIKIN
ncbi:MAG: type VI secretion system tip protein VgrG [Ginsengibacter sp.]